MKVFVSLKKKIFHRSRGNEYKRPILNVIIIANLFPAALAATLNLVLDSPNQTMVAEYLPVVVCGVLLILLYLSQKIRVELPAVVFVSIYTMLGYYLVSQWGVHAPMSWLLFSLTIVIAGILLSARLTLKLLCTHVIVLTTLTYLQIEAGFAYTNWDTTSTMGSLFVSLFFLCVIGVITWLAHLLIERWIRKVQRTQVELERQKALLEEKVEKRATEIHKLQLEKIQHVYRFAELGRLSSGLFHDLNNLLTNVSLNLEVLTSKANDQKIQYKEIILPLQRAVKNVKHLEDFAIAIQHQIKKQTSLEVFSVAQVILQSVQVLEYKAKTVSVAIHQDILPDYTLYGNPLRFGQLITNLLSNSIDAYENQKMPHKPILVQVKKEQDRLIITLKDYGQGIRKIDLESIFKPFYSTKSALKGTGIGLTISKEIVENEFRGSIRVTSTFMKGTVVTLLFPI